MSSAGKTVVSHVARSRLPLRIAVLGIFTIISFFTLRHVLTSPPFAPYNPWAHEYKVEAYDFKPTALESKCFDGAQASHADPIPNVVHFIWGLKHAELDFMAYLAIRSAKLSLRPEKIKLHYVHLDRSNRWWKLVEPYVDAIPHDLDLEFGTRIQKGWDIAHIADILRLDILYREGGIYLDMDVITLRPFTKLRHSERDVVLGHEGGNRWGLCNAVILARKNARFIRRWIEWYASFQDSKWNYHSVLLPKIMLDADEKDGKEDVCPLAPSVFFWPTWTGRNIAFMHASLRQDEAEAFQAQLERYDGAMGSDQLAYHAWGQMARGYLARLNPEIVRRGETRFHLLVRRFLDEV